MVLLMPMAMPKLLVYQALVDIQDIADCQDIAEPMDCLDTVDILAIQDQAFRDIVDIVDREFLDSADILAILELDRLALVVRHLPGSFQDKGSKC